MFQSKIFTTIALIAASFFGSFARAGLLCSGDQGQTRVEVIANWRTGLHVQLQSPKVTEALAVHGVTSDGVLKSVIDPETEEPANEERDNRTLFMVTDSSEMSLWTLQMNAYKKGPQSAFIVNQLGERVTFELECEVTGDLE